MDGLGQPTGAKTRVNPMVGSIHLYSPGYGYGARFPTERNRMTLPANVPQYRKLPDTARFINGSKPTQLVRDDERALRRNADAIVRQTSGEVGIHYLGFDPEPIRMLKKPLREPYPHLSKAKSLDYSTIGGSGVRPDIEKIGSARSSGRREEASLPWTGRPETSPFATTSSSAADKRAEFFHTLTKLDSSFNRQSRRDLFVASLPPKPMQELVSVATSNNHSAMQSKPWTEKLRRDSS